MFDENTILVRFNCVGYNSKKLIVIFKCHHVLTKAFILSMILWELCLEWSHDKETSHGVKILWRNNKIVLYCNSKLFFLIIIICVDDIDRDIFPIDNWIYYWMTHSVKLKLIYRRFGSITTAFYKSWLRQTSLSTALTCSATCIKFYAHCSRHGSAEF